MGKGQKWLNEAYNAIFAGDFDRAIAAFRKAIELEPDNASFFYKLSITYRRSNRLPEAIKAAEKAYSLAPYSHTYRYHCDVLRSLRITGQALQQLEHDDDATKVERELSQAIRLDPLNETALMLMGVLWMRQKRFKEACEMFQEVIKLQPENREAQNYLHACQNKQPNKDHSTKH